MRYKLQMTDTEFGVGMFAAVPDVNLSFNEMVAHLRAHPFDDYMHEFVLRGFKDFRTRKLAKLIKETMHDKGRSDPALAAVLFEACICHQRQAPLLDLFDGLDPATLLDHTPAIHIRSRLLADQPLHRQWIKLFGNNIFTLAPLPAPEDGPKPVFTDADLETPPAKTAAQARQELEGTLPPPKERRPLEETIAHAFAVLDKADAFLGPVMQHKASLSPIASLRHWMAKTRTASGSMSNSLEAIQTSYGRGLSRAQADASCSMEMVERFSSYASFGPSGVLKYKGDRPLVRAAFDELDVPALDPNRVRLEVPYAGQKLHWMEGRAPDGSAVLIPAQFVFLFCNLDEPSLFSALGSTGLASGNTMAEAKVSALTEVIERDADATMPFDPSRCFRIETDDPEVGKLLDGYREDGIDAWFMDQTTELGVPCYKSVVLGKHGDVNKGGGCGLNGKSALVSAMTETAYPYPGPRSGPAPEGLPVRRLEDLPDLSTGSAEGDLMVLEKTLTDSGYPPVYADLTRKDLDIPVCRAIIPGLELISDFDQYSRVSPRLFRNYLALFE
ncbi:MAG: YcaO-like family protein [Desulfovibrionaceae bacterium]|nr:YcaO-like family protein [Desulfovibrionaceae bacterium]